MEDYSKKDFPSTYEDILSMVKSSTSLWNPANSTEADPGVVILKLIAFLEDKAGYRFDMAHAQNYLDSVSDRQSAQDLLQMLGYTMRHARAAIGEVRLQVIDASQFPAEGYIEVPIFTLLTDRTKSLKFFTTSQLTITTATMNNVSVIPVQAGEPFQVSKDGVAYFTLKDVDEQGRLYLGKSNLAQNGVYVFSDENITNEQLSNRASHKWTYVDFSILKPRGNFYTVGEGDNGEMYIQFPEDFEDLLTNQYIEVWATYTEGAASNISANTLALFDESAAFTGSDNLIISQPTDIYTGQDEETIAEATKNYYAMKDICNTLVTAQDFASAIRYLVNGDTQEIEGVLPGQRFFSNAITRTAQSRRLPVRTKSYDKEYTLFETIDTETPCNQIDIVGLKYSSSYPESFQIKPARIGIVSEFEKQMQDNHSLDADIEDASSTDATPAKIDRILAVSTPKMILRISRNATITDLALKQKIRDYFYSKYRADNIEFGKPLDYQTIVDDIRELDPSINSVSLEEMSYDLYKRYAPVDGESVTSVPISDDDKRLAVAKSALAGIIPLYRFYNRQNALSKQNVLYSLSASMQSGSSDSAAESVLALSFASRDYAKLSTTSPQIKDAIFCSNDALQSVTQYGEQTYPVPLMSRNQLLQFRRRMLQDKTTYGYGTQYVFTRYFLIEKNVTVTAQGGWLADGTILSKGSKIIMSSGLPGYLTDASSDNATPPLDKDGNVVATSVTLKGRTDVSSGTIIAKGSGLAPGTNIVADGSIINYNPADVPQGSSYILQKGETLKLLTSSGELKETVTAGGYVKTTGFTLVNQPNPKTLTSLSTVETISTQEEKTSDIGVEFKYILSLRHRVYGDTLSINSTTGYMLEEGEFFIYADKAISEYVILGAGTVLQAVKAGTAVTLHVSYMTAVEDVTRDSGFRDVPDPIKGVVYEFQNFRYPCCAVFMNQTDAGISRLTPISNIMVSSTWEELSGEHCYIYKSQTYTAANSDQEILAAVSYRQFIDDCYSPEGSYDDTRVELFKSEGWQCRRALLLETDEDNICFVSTPCNATIVDGASEASLVPSGDTGALRTLAGLLSASAPFSTTITSTQQTPLLSEGISMNFSRAVLTALSAPVAVPTAVSAGTLEISSSVTTMSGTSNTIVIPFPVPIDGGAALFEKLMFSFTVSENVTGGRVRLSVRAGAATAPNANYLWLQTSLDSTHRGQIEFDCSKSNAKRAGDVITVCSNNWAGTNAKSPVLELSFENLQGVSENFPVKITMSNLSYVVGPSRESGLADSETEDIERAITDAYGDTASKFNWLYTPTEDFSDPTSSLSFFNELHPYNYCTIPYINFDAASIKIIRER